MKKRKKLSEKDYDSDLKKEFNHKLLFWTIDGKKFVTHTVDGKRISRRRINKKFTKNNAHDLFKHNHSISKKITRHDLRFVTEVSYEPGHIRVTKRGAWYVVTIHRRGKTDISARSSKFINNNQLASAREQALNSVYMRLAQELGYDYDADIGKRLFDKSNYSISEKIVKYQ